MKILFFVSLFVFLFFSIKGGKLKVGDIAPDFTLEDAFGNKYTLSSYRGKSPVVIYFYPKANTRDALNKLVESVMNGQSLSRSVFQFLG
jgi:peroxiredoxin Q/BCP